MKRNVLKKIMLSGFLFGMVFTGFAQRNMMDRPLEQRPWNFVAERMPAEWYATDEAKAVAEQVLLYQRPAGGWPKNVPMHKPLTEAQKADLKSKDCPYEPTLDNGATTTEMKFLAKMYEATQDVRYRNAFEKALDYLLEAQYDNGGWPQYYPLKEGYYTHITFNDDAMVNIMNLLKEIFDENPLYGFVATPQMITKAKTAYNKGVACILKTQIYVDGKPTVWCAQHDEVTLKPAKARAYELPSFSGGESGGILLLLMDIPNPSPEIIAAVEGGIKWLEDHKILGIKVEYVMPDGIRDRHIVKDPSAPQIWARFYDLDTQQPYFCGRDGIKKPNLADIEYERRNGYGYYTYAPQKALDAYPAWKERIAKK